MKKEHVSALTERRMHRKRLFSIPFLLLTAALLPCIRTVSAWCGIDDELQFTVNTEKDDIPEGTAYIDLLVPMDEKDPYYQDFRAPEFYLQITADSEIAAYCEEGFRSLTVHSDLISEPLPGFDLTYALPDGLAGQTAAVGFLDPEGVLLDASPVFELPADLSVPIIIQTAGRYRLYIEQARRTKAVQTLLSLPEDPFTDSPENIIPPETDSLVLMTGPDGEHLSPVTAENTPSAEIRCKKYLGGYHLNTIVYDLLKDYKQLRLAYIAWDGSVLGVTEPCRTFSVGEGRYFLSLSENSLTLMVATEDRTYTEPPGQYLLTVILPSAAVLIAGSLLLVVIRKSNNKKRSAKPDPENHTEET